MRETRPLCFSCGFAEGLHVHEVRDDGEECVAWPDMDDFNAGFAALRSEVAALRDALQRIEAAPRDPAWNESGGWEMASLFVTIARPTLTGNGGKP